VITSQIGVKRAVTLICVLTLLLPTAIFAGIRGPGPYNGVVLFDRWGACYLYSGIYLMYVSEKLKDTLRPYQEDFVLLDALEVYQPINPGDGLIKSYGLIERGKSQDRDETPVDGLHITITTGQKKGQLLRFRVVLENFGAKAIEIDTSEFALTVLKRKAEGENDWPMPSDGPSYAIITRRALDRVLHHEDSQVKISASTEVRNRYPLAPGKSAAFNLEFKLPPGEYDLVTGYGGGVHESRVVVSNMIAFDVDTKERAHVVTVAGRK
jgi:hypothetical protein